MWSVFLPDLQVVSDLIEGIGEFVHYLARRGEIEALAVDANDELDWFGHYLLEGLYFEEVRTGAIPKLALNTYTTGFDDYYAYLFGDRQTAVERPRQPMPEVVRDLITQLEREGAKGFSEVVFALLEGSSDTREYVATGIVKQRERASEVGAAGFRIFIGDLTLAFLSSSDPERMDIGAYADACFAQKEIVKAVGVLEPADGSRLRVAISESAPAGTIRAAIAEDFTRKMRSRYTKPGGAL